MISKRILQNLNELRQKNKLCDLQLLSKDGEAFSLHKCVFVAACKRQFEIVCSSENEMNTAKICKMCLPQVSSVELKAMITFIYGENLEDKENVYLTQALSKLHMLDLLENTEERSATVRIKEEPDSPNASVVVEVQVSADPASPPLVPKSVISESSAYPSTKSPNDFYKSNVDLDNDLMILKQECEQLANNDSSFIEIKTEEDEQIEKLMDQISHELELLKTPAQTKSVIQVAKEISDGKVEKVKADLFSTKETESDSVSKTVTYYKKILPSVSAVTALVESNKPHNSRQAEAKSKIIPPSKYRMILPRVSCPSKFPTLSQFLSSAGPTSVTVKGMKPCMYISKDSTESSNLDLQHKTIATILALPALNSCSIIAEKSARHTEVKNSEINENKLKEASQVFCNDSGDMSPETCSKRDSDILVNNDGKHDVEMSSDCSVVLLEDLEKHNSKRQKEQLSLDKQLKNKTLSKTGAKLLRYSAGYRQNQSPSMKRYKCIEKKTLDFGTTCINTLAASQPKTAENISNNDSCLIVSFDDFMKNKNSDGLSMTSSSVPDIDGCNSFQENVKKRTGNAGLFSSKNLSLSEQICTLRERKRRRKALNPQKRPEIENSNDKDSEILGSDQLTKSISTLMQCATKIIGADSECKNKANKIISDLTKTDVKKVSTVESLSIQSTTQSAGDGKVLIDGKSKTYEKGVLGTNLSKLENTGITASKTSPLLAKLLSTIKRVPSCKFQEAERINSDISTNLKAPKYQIDDPKIAFSEKAGKYTGTNYVKEGVITQSFQSPVTCSAMSAKRSSPEKAKSFSRKLGNTSLSSNSFVRQAGDPPVCQSSNYEKQKKSNHFFQPLPNLLLKNVGSTQSNHKTDEIELVTITYSDRAVTQPHIRPFKSVKSITGPDVEKIDSKKRKRKGRPKRCHLSIEQLLHIKPKLPQKKPTSPGARESQNNSEAVIKKVAQENSDHEEKNASRKRHLSMPEVSDLECVKKCKNVNMKKSKQRVKKRNSLEPVFGGENSYLHAQDHDILQVVSPGSLHVGSVDKYDSIHKQPDKTRFQSRNKEENVPQTIIVMGPGQSGIAKYCEKPLFTPEQMVLSNPVFQGNVSSPTQPTEAIEKCAPMNKILLKTVKSYRPIAPKTDKEKSENK